MPSIDEVLKRVQESHVDRMKQAAELVLQVATEMEFNAAPTAKEIETMAYLHAAGYVLVKALQINGVKVNW
jgi:hypothetical protein